MFYVSVFTTQD